MAKPMRCTFCSARPVFIYDRKGTGDPSGSGVPVCSKSEHQRRAKAWLVAKGIPVDRQSMVPA